MKRTLFIIVVGLHFSTSAIFALQTECLPRNQMGREMNINFLKKLNLTPEQEKQLKDIRFQQQKKMIDFNSTIQKNRLDIKNMLSNNSIDENKLLSLTDSNSKIEAEMKSSRIKSWLAAYKLLNDDQKKIWVSHFSMFGNGMMANMAGRRMPMLRDRQQRFNDRQPMRMRPFRNNRPLDKQN